MDREDTFYLSKVARDDLKKHLLADPDCCFESSAGFGYLLTDTHMQKARFSLHRLVQFSR